MPNLPLIDITPTYLTAAIARDGGVEINTDADYQLPDGMFFGLNETVYHRQRRLGSSGLKDLCTSGPTFWWESWLNTIDPPPPEEKDSLTSGSALHKVILEGEEEFAAAYAVLPPPEGMLDTVSQLQGWLTANGLPFKKSMLKAEYIALVLDAKKQGFAIPAIKDVLEAEATGRGQEVIKASLYNRCLLSSRMMTSNPSLEQCFQGGFPEVSILWTERVEVMGADGELHQVPVKCKCRIDYLKLRASVDLKTMANQGTRPFDVSVQMAIGQYRYDTQFAHYMIGREAARALVTQGLVYDLTRGRKIKRTKNGEHIEEPLMPSKRWLQDFAARPHVTKTDDESKGYTWVFVFLQKTGAPESKGYDFRPESMPNIADPGTPKMLVEKGSASFVSRETAVNTYGQHVIEFGDQIWVRKDAIEVMTEDHLPQWIRDEAQS